MQSPTAEDRAIIYAAYDFAEVAHGDEKRKSGEPYIVHPHAIACYLAELGMDTETIVAGILHDTTEDTEVQPEEIEKLFGTNVRFLVDSLTKLSKLRYRGLERHVESLRRLLVATASDIRVIIIKMADRLHNMRTIEHVTPLEKRERIARDTMEVYVPLAERLGMGNIKVELEDLGFAVLEPERYNKITQLIDEKKKEVGNKLEEDIKDLKRFLAENGVRQFKTEYRIKGVRSFDQKARKKGGDVDSIFDLLALRIIVKNTEQCYRVMGIIHGFWKPIPGKIKDYIAAPKTNGYQSIHTTVITRHGVTVEIQIRTDHMHRDAQFGVASHLNYKSGFLNGETTMEWLRRLLPQKNTAHAELGTQPGWLKELTQAGQDYEETEMFEEILKRDFLAERIFAYTPHGDVIDLPQGATPIDFAYYIPSDIGDSATGAKINGKLVPLDTSLRNGDVVEIMTREGATPNKKWLEFIKTAEAKNHIRSALRKVKN